MKRILLFYFLILFSQFCFSQSQEESTAKKSAAAELSNRTTISSNEVNLRQGVNYWKLEVSKNSKNSHAWFNYYRSNRLAFYTEHSNEIAPSQQKELDAIVAEAEGKIKDTYEYHVLKYWNSKNKREDFSHLQAAYKLNENKDLMDEFALYAEMISDAQMRKQYSMRMKSERKFSSAVSIYNQYLLNSLPENAVLFTYGEEDTYPLWILQDVESLRKDVTVFKMELLEDAEYLKEKSKKIQLNIPSDHFSMDRAKWLEELIKLNPKRTFAFGLTINPLYLKSLSKKLYVNGLFLQYSETGLSNIENLEAKWLDGTLIPYTSGKEFSMLNSNFFIPLLLLHEKYIKEGKANEAQAIRNYTGNILAPEQKKQRVLYLMEKHR